MRLLPVPGPALALSVALASVLVIAPIAAFAAATTISTDPYTQATCAASAQTNHHTEVEPDTFSHGSTRATACGSSRRSLSWSLAAFTATR